MSNVLITGFRGYLGSVLTEMLQENTSINVIGYDNCLYENNSSGYSKSQDFRNIDFFNHDKIDVVIHLAGISTNYDPPEKIYSDIAMRINYEETVEFAKKAKKAGVKKFIFASSASVYGDSTEKYVTEESIPNPLTSYAVSKLYAEKELLQLKSDTFAPIILRMVTLFGLSARMRFDVLVNNLILSSLVNNKIILNSDGNGTRPQVHVKDVCKIYESIILNNSDYISGEVINIGRDDYNISVLNIAQELSRVLNCELIVGQEKTVDKRSYNVDFSKQKKLFPNVSFNYNLDYASKEISDFFKNSVLENKWYENAEYYNLSQMKYIIDNNRVDNDLAFL